MTEPTHFPFANAEAVATYAEGPPRMVPGWADMVRMTDILLAERVPRDGRVLVVGAGGGLELKRFAQAHSEWSFEGVDPSRPMLDLASATLGPLGARVHLHEGYVDDASAGPFDGATCLLTLHFVEIEERRRMLAQIRRRLRPGAPFVVAHLSVPEVESERQVWLNRYAAFAVSSGIEPSKAEAAAKAVNERLSIVSPQRDEEMLREAGFSDVACFYAGLAFRGWVAVA